MSSSLDFPDEPKPGEPLRAEWGIKVARLLRKLQWVSSASIEVSIGTRGTSGRVRSSGGSAAAIPRTLYVTDASNEDDGAQVAVSVGRIANLPLTIDGVELGAEEAPLLPVATGVVFIKATFLEGEDIPDSLEILCAANVPEDTETEGHKVLAEVTVASGAISALHPVCWNLSEIQRCGPTTYLWGGFGGS